MPWKRVRIQGNTGARHSETGRPSLGRVALVPLKRGSLPRKMTPAPPEKGGPVTLQMGTRPTEEGDRGPTKEGLSRPADEETRASEKGTHSSARDSRTSDRGYPLLGKMGTRP